MTSTIQVRPWRVNGVIKSKWMASRNPILYVIRREDANFSAIQFIAPGNIEITVTGIDVSAYFEAGNSVYVKSSDLMYVGIGEIISSVFGGDTKIVVNITYTADSFSGGYINNLDKRQDWSVAVDPYNFDTSVSLADGGIKFYFYPDAITGETICDISEILRAFVYAQWQYQASEMEVEDGASLKFAIKYQEYYDGVLQGSIFDDTSPFYAVHAAMQIIWADNNYTYDHGGNLISYVPGDSGRKLMLRGQQGLVSMNPMKMWRGYPLSISTIIGDDVSIVFAKIIRYFREYRVDGSIIQTLNDILLTSGKTEKVNRIKVPVPHAETRYADFRLQYGDGNVGEYANVAAVPNRTDFAANWVNIDDSGGVNWGIAAGSAVIVQTVGQNGDYFRGIVNEVTLGFVPIGAPCRIDVEWTSSAGTRTLQMFVRDSVSSIRTLVASSTITGGGSYSSPAYQFTAPHNFDHIEFKSIATAGTSTVTLLETGDLVWDCVPIVQTTRINVEEPFGNSVYLVWKNSAGGDQYQLFEHNQEFSYRIENNKKAKRMRLFANSVEYLDAEAIQELNSSAEVYRNAIIELSSAVIKTHSQVGQQVYIVRPTGQKIGVVVIPVATRSETKRLRHSAEIEIELPEVL